MTAAPLFLPAALTAQRGSELGKIFVRTVLPTKVIAGSTAALALAIVAFFVTASYTQRVTVGGALVPATGVIRLYPQQGGRVAELRVTEGQTVKRGDVLFVINSDRNDEEGSDILEQTSREARARVEILNSEVGSASQVFTDKMPAMISRMQDLRDEQAQVSSAIADSRTRMSITQKALERYEILKDKGLITQLTMDQAQANQLDVRRDLNGLQRDRLRLNSQLAELRSQMAALPNERRGSEAQLARALSQAKQDAIESRARREEIVRSPFEGQVTGIDALVGQTVSANRPLALILRKGAKLQATLQVPSRAIGFIRNGTRVKLRYNAFPYQKFGQPEGRIIEISKVPFSVAEIPGENGSSNGQGTTERVYIAKVALDRQVIRVYGQNEPLQPGMALDADLLLERRRLYEWAFAPVLNLTRGLR